MKKPYAVLFVCTGNICRSPTAEAVFRHRLHERGLQETFRHDSAGIEGYHVGEAPDRRSVATLHRAGIEMGDLRARKMRKVDFHDFDLILAMDNSHLAALKRMAPEDATAEIALYVEYAMGKPAEVPDPYYGGPTDFARVVELIDDATTALLARLNT